MVRTRLLQAACAVALLAAAPAFAQTNTAPADTGVDNTPNVPSAHDRSATPRMGSGGGHSMHRMMHSRSDTSQNSAVDQLNDQSYQAVQNGQPYTGMSTTGGQGAGGMYGGVGGMGGGSPGASGTGGAPGASDGAGGGGK